MITFALVDILKTDKMKRNLLFVVLLAVSSWALAEDGSRLWLRYAEVNQAKVTGPECVAADELRKYFAGSEAQLVIDPTVSNTEGYVVSGHTVKAKTERGLLYGAYALLRGEQGVSEPFYKLRILNHWDNLDGTVERGYAGESIFWPDYDAQHIKEYARACASIGINGTVLNNVNASPQMLSDANLVKVRHIADILRPYGIRVYLSVNFASPMGLGGLKTADPLAPQVQQWWKRKTREIYKHIPDFGGYLVKANSEGQPGPGDYGRSHADGANMLAQAVAPYGGIIMWRSFVYGANHKGEDRVKQAVSEFLPCDGKFASNVILQSKNGPLDFQPREPYAPIFDNIRQTPQMVELQITQEYLGQSRHLVYLAPMWREFFRFVEPGRLVGIAGVANIGTDTNWCGHHFSQANWYAFGRLAWNPAMKSEEIAAEWLSATFGKAADEPGSDASQNLAHESLLSVMLRSREACVDYMMPLGLHHIFKFDHHYGPEPDGFIKSYPLEWCPVYYHQADKQGVGFNRTHTGSDATSQYREPFCSLYDNPATCPENLLLWFHHVPWTYRMNSGRTLWEELQYRYNRGVGEVEDFLQVWQQCKPFVDEQRCREVDERLQHQLANAREWRDTCLKYFATFANN